MQSSQSAHPIKNLKVTEHDDSTEQATQSHGDTLKYSREFFSTQMFFTVKKVRYFINIECPSKMMSLAGVSHIECVMDQRPTCQFLCTTILISFRYIQAMVAKFHLPQIKMQNTKS